MRLDVLDRVVAGVGVKRVDRVHAVHAFAAAVAPFENFHLHPMLALMQPGERDAAQVADAGAHLSGHALRKRLHHRVGKRVAGTEARDDRRREGRVCERPLRRDDVDRSRQAHVLRHVPVDRAVEKDRPEREPDRAIDRAFERHVDRPIVDLRRGARQIDGHLIPAHLQRRLDRADRGVLPHRRPGNRRWSSRPHSRRLAARRSPCASGARNNPSDPGRRA